jgi:prevent-host-death family protein
METIAISRFKATCLAVLERVRRTKQPILVTRFGKPVAQVTPAPPPSTTGGWLGAMKGTAKVRGDIVAPVGDEKDWEALAR